MTEINNPEVANVFENYPPLMQQKMRKLRALILKTADELEDVKDLQETLKWGEPSYLAKGGSTIRIDWKPKKPDQYALYFNCNSRLVDTFIELYRDKLKFEGNRAIVFKEDDELPAGELKHCITLALTYHKRKHLPLLGAFGNQ
jgi:uncharacterized protein DUF1801